MAYTVFFTAGMKVLGMAPDVDHGAMSPGMFRTFQNVRARYGTIRVRGGMQEKTTSGTDAGTLAGSARFLLNGVEFQIVAIDTGSVTRLYQGQYNDVFTEFTQGTGKYGNTRLSGADGTWVTFTVAADTTSSTLAPFDDTHHGKDLVVASDGTTTVVFDVDAAECAVCAPVWHCGEGRVRQHTSYPYYTSLATSNLAAGATTGTGTVATNTAHAVTGGKCPTWTFTAVNDAAVLTVTTGTTLCKNKQAWMVLDCPDDGLFMDWLKVEVYDATSATFRTLWNPTSATSEKPVLVRCEKGFTLALFPVDPLFLPDHTYTDVRLTYAGSAAPSATVSVNLIAMGGSGTTPGGRSFAVSYYNNGSRCESRGVVCDNKLGVSLKDLGCQDSRNYVPVPDTPLSYYAYQVHAQQPSNADMQLGIDWLIIYSRAFGAVDYYHTASAQLASYSAGWSHYGGRTALQDFTTTVDTDVVNMRVMPDAYGTAPPACTASATAGGRMFCGNAKAPSIGALDTASDLYISEQDHPFRFREILDIKDGVASPTGATKVTFPGERVLRIVPMAGPLVGKAAAWVFTDQNVWVIDGEDSAAMSRPRRLSSKGTSSPWSVATYNDVCVYLDEDRRIVVLDASGSVRVLSTGRVNSVLFNIPANRLSKVFGIVYRDRYYLAYTIAGRTANTVCLVYDFVMDCFSRDVGVLGDTPTFGPWHTVNSQYLSDGPQLRFWTESGVGLFEHDRPSLGVDSDIASGNTGIIPYIETPLVSDGAQWSDVSFGPLGVHCQVDHGNSLSASWTGRPSGTVSAGTVSLSEPGYATVASLDAAADTATFAEHPGASSGMPWETGDGVDTRTTANGFTAGTTVYARRGATNLVWSFYDTRAHALDTAHTTGLVNVTGTSSTLTFDRSVSSVRRWTPDPVDGFVDGGAYAVFTGTMTGNLDIYTLIGSHETVPGGPDSA